MSEVSIQHMPWLLTPLHSLYAALQRGQLANAYLVNGPFGSGHRDLADAIQAVVMCEHPIDQIACGHCSSCRLLVAGAHPDAWCVEPQKEGHRIKIDQIRELNERLEQTAQLGGYRCVIIAPADGLNTASANSLLKVLEEPGEKVVFLLVSEYPKRLLSTIRSRCQNLSVCVPNKGDALAWLQLHHNETDYDRILMSWKWGGHVPLRALSLMQSKELSQIDSVTECWKSLGSTASTAEWKKLCDQFELGWVIEVLHRYATMMLAERGEGGQAEWFWLSDQLVELKRLAANGVHLNAQLMWEKLVLQWEAIQICPPTLRVSFIDT